ncbi:hypothetical protein [Zooshikella ganghwensis]|uniref:hypothetical protein n=1 Tax=Zooshikella ganghwensis TaxID=202772 RepID=UPI0004118CCB|nr:hypothetical protein [Zooshikella ganghwensis]
MSEVIEANVETTIDKSNFEQQQDAYYHHGKVKAGYHTGALLIARTYPTSVSLRNTDSVNSVEVKQWKYDLPDWGPSRLVATIKLNPRESKSLVQEFGNN